MNKPRSRVELQIDDAYREIIDRRFLRQVVRHALVQEKVPPAELCLTITSDERLRELNRTFRQVDAVTDVLSFPLLSPQGGPFVAPPDGLLHLGDIVVSYPRAQEQAQEYGHSLQRETAYLIVHGLLHLLGYDHQRQEDQERMRKREEVILAALPSVR
jgi:probable rRNA maturation factor